jgi:hypothetical protein
MHRAQGRAHASTRQGAGLGPRHRSYGPDMPRAAALRLIGASDSAQTFSGSCTTKFHYSSTQSDTGLVAYVPGLELLTEAAPGTAKRSEQRPQLSRLSVCRTQHCKRRVRSGAEDADMTARKEHATSESWWASRVGVGTCCRVSGGDSSTTFNGARLRRGIFNPQAPAGCSGDVKQQCARTIAITDHSERQPKCSVIAGCCSGVAGDWRARLPMCTNAMPILHSYVNGSGKVSASVA